MQRLGCTLRAEEAAVADAATCQCSSGSSLARRQVDARDLEERDPLDAGIAVPLGRLEQPEPEVGSQRRHVDRVGLLERQASVSGRHEAPRVRLGESRADEDVLDSLRRRCSRDSWTDAAARAGNVAGTSSIRNRDDLLDEVDGARHVERAPGRHGHVVAVETRSRGARAARAAPPRGSSDHSAGRRARGGAEPPAATGARPARRRAQSAAHRRARRGARSRRRRPARQRTGRRPSPSASTTRSGAAAAARRAAPPARRSSPPPGAGRSSRPAPRCARRP